MFEVAPSSCPKRYLSKAYGKITTLLFQTVLLDCSSSFFFLPLLVAALTANAIIIIMIQTNEASVITVFTPKKLYIYNISAVTLPGIHAR
ncbi:hypothetical protein BDV26DRAFT_107936 [Aspergillus bertholletiae]|uniref:Uncharacterized protein n=1 Tax=Aspergillus bertholletiae TaxID=1226010 RepID=A0A5N7AQZ3_9EURO|nr:hypothetical protein BDV26DRAFT_107936 [Aspergillus bertholletiae]